MRKQIEIKIKKDKKISLLVTNLKINFMGVIKKQCVQSAIIEYFPIFVTIHAFFMKLENYITNKVPIIPNKQKKTIFIEYPLDTIAPPNPFYVNVIINDRTSIKCFAYL